MIKQAAVVMQPTIKKDKTATLRFGTLQEVSKPEFSFLSNGFYDGETGILIFVKEENYLDFILSEAKRLAKEVE